MSRDTTPAKIKVEKFISLYAADPKKNGARCARDAGYAGPSARVTASKMLKDPEIRARIMEKEQQLLKKFDMDADSVMRELAAIVHFDVRKLYREDGTLKEIHELDDATAKALSSVQVDEIFTGRGKTKIKVGETKTVKVFDKNSAIEKAMKHFKLLGDNGQASGNLIVYISANDVKLG